ncbi:MULTISPECIES: hypothetical protein [Chelatococcus]|uniref:Microcompartment protein CcmK/EutM n=1 Tax=Chelatococcus caeni TaxID=1348468 RepID=A0A840BZV3_9HYPH|nr:MULTISPECIES: hypothetical protein [Chelatococcus]ALA17023.1 hypothetical protein AL346_05900 [Chelatococcus sp. CO-6]MBB4017252.1 microcompartment protein CcmK/EutM [Chelatococcus caeni]
MEKDLARHVIRVAFRNAAELQGLLVLLKEHCSAEEYKVYAAGIASAIDGIGAGLTNKVLSSHPDLAEEIEASLAKYDRLI